MQRIQLGQQTIKQHMPEVYALIQGVAEDHGRQVWALVRRGLAGEAGCFWATENGVTVGTPFAGQPAWQTVALRQARPGPACVCIMAPMQPAQAGG